MAISVAPVPAFQDNYLWVIHDGKHATVADPGDAAPVIDYLTQHSLELTAILITHHQADHIGVDALLKKYSVPVFGPAGEDIPQLIREWKNSF